MLVEMSQATVKQIRLCPSRHITHRFSSCPRPGVGALFPKYSSRRITGLAVHFLNCSPRLMLCLLEGCDKIRNGQSALCPQPGKCNQAVEGHGLAGSPFLLLQIRSSLAILL